MDLNRPFGAGAFSMQPGYQGQIDLGRPDRRSRTSRDEQRESAADVTGPAARPSTATVNYSADGGRAAKVNGTSVSDSLAARQLYARHLYVLALALADTQALLADLQKTIPRHARQT